MLKNYAKPELIVKLFNSIDVIMSSEEQKDNTYLNPWEEIE